MLIDFDLENYPLYVKNSIQVGSKLRMNVVFFDANLNVIGSFEVLFEYLRYFLHKCKELTPFPSSLPPELEKVWKISLTRIPDRRLIVHCNEVEVLNLPVDCWNDKYVRKIKFHSVDKSDFYKKGVSPGKSLIGL